jgi:hypothetical protein
MMTSAVRVLLIVCGAALAACGRDSASTAVSPARSPAAPPAASRLIHTPPISKLAPEQLRSLSMECQKYEPDKSTRGPYDAAYCDDAIAAWSDSPLQIVPISKEPLRDSTAPPK